MPRIVLLAVAFTVLRVDATGANAAPATAVVLVANGSGDFWTVTRSLSKAAEEACAPVYIETLDWSHGLGRYVTDHVDRCNQLAQARRLACRALEYRRARPDLPVYLVGHSAGCAVVLAAAEQLPPDTLERIVLLAPSVCSEYDLRPALRSARCGIDSFNSSRDVFILGLGMRLVGTADRRWAPAAGRVGFRPVICDEVDVSLYGRLHQHSWDSCVEWTGNRGMHYGSNRPEFARAYVVPLLVPPCQAVRTQSAYGR